MKLKQKPKPKIIEVLRPTPGRLHYWVKAQVGSREVIIKKETKNIDRKLIDKYKKSLFY